MKSVKKKPVPAVAPVVVRLPQKLISTLDKSAKSNCRSRSSEIRARLLQTLSNGVAP